MKWSRVCASYAKLPREVDSRHSRSLPHAIYRDRVTKQPPYSLPWNEYLSVRLLCAPWPFLLRPGATVPPSASPLVTPLRAARRGAALKRGRAPPASDAISLAPINHRYPEERTLGPTESAAVPWPGRRPRPRSLGGRQSPRAARPELLCSRPGRAGPRPSRRGSRTRLDRLVRKRSDVHVNGHRDYCSRRLYSGRVPISTWASPETNRVKFGVEKLTETDRLHA